MTKGGSTAKFDAEQSAAREAATRDILRVINRSRDDEMPVFDAILVNAANLCGATTANLVLVDGVQQNLDFVHTHGRPILSFKPGETSWPLDSAQAIAVAVRDGRIVHEEDFTKSDLYLGGDPTRVRLVEEAGIRSVLAVPLMQSGQAIGAIALHRHDEARAFSESDIRLIEAFSEQAVIAIENVRQFRELQMRLEREAALRGVLEVISTSRTDEQPVFDTVLECATRLCNAPLAFLSLVDESGTYLSIPAHRGARPDMQQTFSELKHNLSDSEIVSAYAVRERKVIRIDDMSTDPTYNRSDPRRARLIDVEGVRSYLVVPMVRGAECFGTLNLYRREVAPFSDDDTALAEAFAQQALIAIENVRQFKALQARTAEVLALNSNLENRVAEQVDQLDRLGRLRRFLSPQVADAVVSSGDEKMLGSHRALIATVFCDIRGFTAFCEKAEPEEAIEILQTYHEELGKLIQTAGAGFDHRAGDGVMVVFNDPIPCDDPTGDAVRMAVNMRSLMAELCSGWRKLGHHLGFGVGISLGYATVGMVGFEGRHDYTASGTAVNLAARLCDMAEDREILLSARAAVAVEQVAELEPAGTHNLKGFHAPVDVFRVTALKEAA